MNHTLDNIQRQTSKKCKKNIFTFLVIISFFIISNTSIYSQVKGTKNKNINAIENRYYQFPPDTLRYIKDFPSISKFYFNSSVGMDWNHNRNLENKNKGGINANFTLGYRFTPVHGIEAGFKFGSSPIGILDFEERATCGVGLNYVLDIIPLIKHTKGNNIIDINTSAGIAYTHQNETTYLYPKTDLVGLNMGLKIQYNIAKNLGVFIKPEYTSVIAVTETPSIKGRPFYNTFTLNFGVQANFYTPETFKWNTKQTMSLKTNLLFDILTGINFETEFAIKNHWSIALELVSPWWKIEKEHKYFQILNITIEGKYWFGKNRENRKLLGWFIGAHLGIGMFDIMSDPLKGKQGEFILSGLSIGYAHKISPHLALEYTLGAGAYLAKYRKYFWDDYDYSLYAPTAQYWRTTIFGPTRAKVSLVWLITLHKERRILK